MVACFFMCASLGKTCEVVWLNGGVLCIAMQSLPPAICSLLSKWLTDRQAAFKSQILADCHSRHSSGCH